MEGITTSVLQVALPVSAWIEIKQFNSNAGSSQVALPVSAWIEMTQGKTNKDKKSVALPVSAWIEMAVSLKDKPAFTRRTPRECVD